MDIERVLVSPYLRAEQTLDVVGECMNLPKDVDVMPELTPCGDVGMVSAYLQALANEGVKTALVVSHLPLVGYLVSELCPGKRPDVYYLSDCLRHPRRRRQGRIQLADEPLQFENGESHLRLSPSELPLTEAPAATTLQLQSVPIARHRRRTLWCLMERHNMRMLRQPQRRLLLEDVFAVSVHHAGAEDMFAAAGGNQRAQFLFCLHLG